MDLVKELSKIEVDNIEKEKPKVFEKKDITKNEGGYADTYSISGMNIVAIVITIISLIIMFLATR